MPLYLGSDDQGARNSPEPAQPAAPNEADLLKCRDPWEFLRLYRQLPPDDRDPLPCGASCNYCGAAIQPMHLKLIAAHWLWIRIFCANPDHPHLIQHLMLGV